jgi:hypothetical protein
LRGRRCRSYCGQTIRYPNAYVPETTRRDTELVGCLVGLYRWLPSKVRVPEGSAVQSLSPGGARCSGNSSIGRRRLFGHVQPPLGSWLRTKVGRRPRSVQRHRQFPGGPSRLGGTRRGLAVRSPSAGARRALEPAALSGQVRFEDEAAPTAEAGQTGTGPSDDLDRARSDAALSHADLFLRYFELGGMSSELELEAFCYGFLEPTPHDQDVLAHALNERFSELGRNHPVPYSTAPGGADS